MRTAIIGGSGKMGRWLADFLLKEGQEVVLIGRSEKKLFEARQHLTVEVTTEIGAVKSANVVVISVPIDAFETVVKQLPPYLEANQIIVDITSVKSTPVALMQKYIKKGMVLGTHPVFGPGAKGIRNQNIVLTPTNAKEKALAKRIKGSLEERGARVTLMSPAEHDERMAVILGLAHFIAIVSADTLLNFDKLKEMEQIGGSTFLVLLTLVESVISEDPELYASLQINLPKVTEAEDIFQRNSRIWTDMVRNRDKQGFVQKMTSLKERFEKSDPDFGKAYQNMYKLLE